MRKDVILGMTIGGVMLAVLIVYLTISTGPKHNRHPVDTGGQVANGGGPSGDGSGQASADGSGNGGEDKSANAKPGDGQDLATAKPQVLVPGSDEKKDPVWGSRLWPSGTPLLVTTTPGPEPAKLQPKTEGSGEGDQTPPPPTPGRITRSGADRPSGTEVYPAAPATQPVGKSSKHTVQKGETFTTIAAAVYGSPNFYPYLLRANPKIDPTRLKPGTEINIPDPAEVKPPEKPAERSSDATPAAAKKEPTIDPKSEYIVQSNDSLYKIALKLYGKVEMVEKIYELNKTVIGDNPAKLKLGMVLKLPAEPTAKQ